MAFFAAFFSPNEQVGEDESREEEAPAAGVWAEEQSQVTQRAEHQHPQHVLLKEQEEGAHPRQHRHHVLHGGHAS